ncbi:arginase family protein [Streptomyces sp. L2]|uniref:arginase family protein n=1 Tax=Streptomyces sp. L2 TaxID=2162665 RepID=UPI00101257F8|nr:arginase family protein [Streptomyces sp. L2]
MTQSPSRPYLRNPRLELVRGPRGVVVEDVETGRRIEASPQLLAVWESFAVPRPLDAGAPSLAPDVVGFLLRNELLVPASEAGTVMSGLLKKSRRSVGTTAAWTELSTRELAGQWCLFGVPVAYDCPRTHSPVGGPDAIRASLRLFSSSSGGDAGRSLWDWNRNRGFHLSDALPLDLGDICHNPRTDTADVVERKVRLAAREVLAAGGRPLVLGGEHWLSLPVLQAVAQHHQSFSVIHFDAHTDRYATRKANQSGLTNGNVMSHVEALGPVQRLLQIGIREFDYAAGSDEAPSSTDKTRVVSAAQVIEGSGIEEIFGDIPRESPVYVSIDADVLDPVVAPEVAWPVMGGLTFREIDAALRFVTQEFEVIGADLVEVTSSEQSRNLAAMALAGCAGSLLLAGR